MSLYQTGDKMPLRSFTAVLLAVACSGCAVKKLAINKLGDALASPGTTFSADNDPAFVRDAVPFSLKLMESLLAETPRHRGLLLASASGFTQYAYAFLQQEADETEDRDLDRAAALRLRARRMYLRARDYGVRGLETRYAGFGARIRVQPQEAARAVNVRDVALLYWTAAAWGAAISVSKTDPEIVADQPVVEALIDRALALDEKFDGGAIHSFLIAYEGSRQGAQGPPEQRARLHFDRAMQLSGGFQAGPLVSLAENVCVPKQDRKEFRSLLEKALAMDVDAKPEFRLVNLVMQRRARWLLDRTGKLFVE